jgi:cysteine desulfurase
MPKSNSLRRGVAIKPNKIYMDYSASATPNPSSIHMLGLEAKIKLQNARKEVADILGAHQEEVIFTSGGTESNNLAIQGVVLAWHKKNLEKILPHIITTNIEHPSVLETCKLLTERKFAEVSIVPVEKNGIVDPKKIKKEIKDNTVLVSVMYANNEIGTIQPIKEIAKEIKHWKKMQQNLTPSPLSLIRRGVGERCIFPLFHTDAVQAVNYLDLNVERLGVDLLSLSGTKIEGAGRIGVLYKRKSVELAPVFGGGDQENGLRPGTENLFEILKFASALKLVNSAREKETKRLTILRDYFIRKLEMIKTPHNKSTRCPTSLPGIIINGDLQNRLPNNVNITVPKIPSELLVIELSSKGIMASAKSACKSGEAGGSYVIKAICRKPGGEVGGVRFSMGRQTTKKEIDYTVKSLSEILKKLKKWS